MRHVPIALGVVVFGFITGCVAPTPFTCADNTGCVDATGAQGICEPTHVCSFLDVSCGDSHRRFAPAYQGAPQGTCVPAVAAACRLSQFAVGADVICALRADNTLFCWGDNSKGQLGIGTLANAETPVPVGPPLPHNGSVYPVGVSAGDGHVCALLNTGEVWCWGANNAKQLGDRTGVAYSAVPVQAVRFAADGGSAPLDNLVSLSVGGLHACGLGSDHLVYCWGENQSGGHGGQCGADPAVFDDVPAARAVDGLDGVISVEAGDEFACAIKDDHSAWCWGVNSDHELGNGTAVDSFAAIESGISSVSALGVIDQSVCVLAGDSTVSCWGYNQSGNTGTGSVNAVSVPTQLEGVVADKLGQGGTSNTNCLIDVNGAMSCFGDNSKGQAALGMTSGAVLSPTPAKLITVESVILGKDNGCALTLDGALWCWGENDSGQLGQGKGTTGQLHASPVRVNVPCQ